MKELAAAGGPKKEYGEENLVVRLDRNCLSCSGNSRSIINVFTVACLSYRPSNVVYKQQDF